jgi:hypothetical protein
MSQTPKDIYERWQAGDQVEPVELARALRAALDECDRLRAEAADAAWPPASVIEALNSGDGSYRP